MDKTYIQYNTYTLYILYNNIDSPHTGKGGENFIKWQKMMWHFICIGNIRNNVFCIASTHLKHGLVTVCGMYFAVARIIITQFIVIAAI